MPERREARGNDRSGVPKNGRKPATKWNSRVTHVIRNGTRNGNDAAVIILYSTCRLCLTKSRRGSPRRRDPCVRYRKSLRKRKWQERSRIAGGRKKRHGTCVMHTLSSISMTTSGISAPLMSRTYPPTYMYLPFPLTLLSRRTGLRMEMMCKARGQHVDSDFCTKSRKDIRHSTNRVLYEKRPQETVPRRSVDRRVVGRVDERRYAEHVRKQDELLAVQQCAGARLPSAVQKVDGDHSSGVILCPPPSAQYTVFIF
jgi:hypothetical protein